MKLEPVSKSRDESEAIHNAVSDLSHGEKIASQEVDASPPAYATRERTLRLKRPSMKSDLTLAQLERLTHTDDSLERYRKALLGDVHAPENDSRTFVLERIQFVCEVSEQEEKALRKKNPDASGILALYSFGCSEKNDTEEIRKQLAAKTMKFPDGCLMRLVLIFRLQHTISSNLHCFHLLGSPQTSQGASHLLQRCFSSPNVSKQTVVNAAECPVTMTVLEDAFIGSYAPRDTSYGWSSDYYEISSGMGKWFRTASGKELDGQLLFRDDDHSELECLAYRCIIVPRSEVPPYPTLP